MHAFPPRVSLTKIKFWDILYLRKENNATPILVTYSAQLVLCETYYERTCASRDNHVEDIGIKALNNAFSHKTNTKICSYGNLEMGAVIIFLRKANTCENIAQTLPESKM